MKLDGSWEVVNDSIRRRLVSLGTKLMSMEVEFKAGAIGTMHQHPHEQQTLIRTGSFRFTIGQNVHILRAGDIVNISGDTPHEAVALEDGVLIDTFTPLREDLLER
ncbi:MAG: cupin domain-containing protein [Deinococcales bacterium]